jgi:hypothetical protein
MRVGLAYPPKQGRAIPGRVIGRWADDHALIRAEDGRVLELPATAEVSDFEVGDRVEVYLDGGDMPVGWYLPDRQQGVDLRGRADDP